MKRQIKRIAQLIIVFCFAALTLTGCVDEGEEIFNNADTPTEESTDEEDEKKSKPGGS